MKAWICLLPPLFGGKAQTAESLLEDLRYAGIVYHVDEERLSAAVRQEEYLSIFLIASGAPPVEGEDGAVEEAVPRQQPLRLEIPEGSPADFSGSHLLHPVQKGDVLCRIRPSVPSRPGTDVTGASLSGREVKDAAVPAGVNTELSPDGTALLAAMDGVVFWEEDRFTVSPQKLILGDLQESDGPVNFTGDVYIGGNVLDGAVVKATGNIVICGEVRGAQVEAGSSLRVQKGVKGGGRARVSAAVQLQCTVLENVAAAEAGTCVFAETIADSSVSAGKAVYVLSGRGLIVGGHVIAKELVSAKKIGNLSGAATRVSVGLCPETEAELAQTEAKLAEFQGTLEKLRKNSSALRAAGSALSLEKRELLARLLEQRSLCEAQEKALQQRVKELKQIILVAMSGKILCEELNPVAEIQIGTQSETFRNQETRCNIHSYMGRVVVK